MEVHGPKTVKALKNPANDAFWDWLMIRGCDEEFRFYDSVIHYDENCVTTIKSGSEGMDAVIRKEIAEVQRQRLENPGHPNKDKIIDAGRK